MKAVFITRPGDSSVLQIKEVEPPSLSPAEILIRVKAFGLNFADILARMGIYPDAPKMPFVPGYEVAGEVEAWGDSVSGFKKGDRVVAMTEFGGYAEFAKAHFLTTLPAPPHLNAVELAAVPVNAITAHFALVERGNLHPGERILIQAAAGGVGLFAVQIAKEIGATIFGTAGSAGKCEFLKEMGVHHPINYREEDFEKAVRNFTHGEGVDLVLDSLGGEALKKAYRILRAHGRLVAIGIASMVGGSTRNFPRILWQFLKTPRFMPYRLMSDDKSFIGLNIKRVSEKRPELLAAAFQKVLQQVSEGKLRSYVARTFPLEEIAEAQRFLQDRKAIGKVVVTTE